MQGPPSAPKKPGSQMHCSASVLAVLSVVLPAAHGVHAEFARASLYSPCPHAAHERKELLRRSGSNPGSQLQFPSVPDPASENESCGHATQTASVVAPTAEE